jgi:hypothetical protein
MNYADQRSASEMGMPMPPQDRPSTLTESALDGLESAIYAMHENISAHEARIGLCLRAPAPKGETAAGTLKAAPDSALLNRLDSIRSKLNEAYTRLEDISSRVTL